MIERLDEEDISFLADNVSCLSRKDWVKLVSNEFQCTKTKKFPLLVSLLRTDYAGIDEDQRYRTQVLLSEMKTQAKHKCVILEGPGRILKHMFKSESCPESITVVDINPIMNKLHELIFPSSINCVESNIVTYLQQLELSGELPNIYVYLNFCGIRNLSKKDFQELERIMRIYPSNFMISCSYRGIKFKNNTESVNFLKSLATIGFVPISIRKFFITLGYDKKFSNNSESFCQENNKPISMGVKISDYFSDPHSTRFYHSFPTKKGKKSIRNMFSSISLENSKQAVIDRYHVQEQAKVLARNQAQIEARAYAETSGYKPIPKRR